jgi:peptidoglycan-associated lipoprotein
MRYLSLRPLLILTVILLSACGSSVKLNDPNVTIEDRSVNANDKTSANTNAIDPRSIQTIDVTANDPLNDPKGELAQRSIYFDYNSYTIKEDFSNVIQAHAKYLVKNPKRKIFVQGNTDERGSREYNLALGQKRAEAVRNALSILSVPEAQVEAVSLGEEKPRALGENETAWSENRRADIVYEKTAP